MNIRMSEFAEALKSFASCSSGQNSGYLFAIYDAMNLYITRFSDVGVFIEGEAE